MLTQRRYHPIAVGVGGPHLREPVPGLAPRSSLSAHLLPGAVTPKQCSPSA
jgi:hypothetical protein